MSLDDVVAGIEPTNEGAKRLSQTATAEANQAVRKLGAARRVVTSSLAGIFGTERPSPFGQTVIVAAGDHGVVDQGVTDYSKEVTAQMVLNFFAGGAAVNVMASRDNVQVVVVDAGLETSLPRRSDLRVVGAGRGTA